jgi:hypothetical protein
MHENTKERENGEVSRWMSHTNKGLLTEGEGLVQLTSSLSYLVFWQSLLTELSEPCTLSHTNMHENKEERENGEVSRWMSHTNKGILSEWEGLVQLTSSLS